MGRALTEICTLAYAQKDRPFAWSYLARLQGTYTWWVMCLNVIAVSRKFRRDAMFVDLPSDRETISLLKEEFNAADQGVFARVCSLEWGLCAVRHAFCYYIAGSKSRGKGGGGGGGDHLL